MLGDSVVNDVLTDPNSAAILGDRKQQVVRQRIAFNQLRAPFSVGAGKFRLKDAYMNGPMLGATMRGSVDFKAQTVDLGGTYVPLYGLNSALGAIPILGRVLVGRQGEGVVGITFAIKGKLDGPHGSGQSHVGDDARHLPADLRVHGVGSGAGRRERAFVLHTAWPDQAQRRKRAANSRRPDQERAASCRARA